MNPLGRWRLDTITVRNFRGIEREQKFEMAAKPALFSGNNGVGKSTIALALQWILFGRFPDGVLANIGLKRFLPPVTARDARPYGKCAFIRGSQRLVVQRDEHKQTFNIELGADSWHDEDAEAQRDLILGVDMDAFVRTVLLHQTRTRGLLLDDAKSRNHAIDMLLGVETAQNLYETLKPKRFLDAAKVWRTDIEQAQRDHAAQGKILERQFDDAIKAGREMGFTTKDFKWQALSARYKALALEVVQLAAKHDVLVPESAVPDSLNEARSFSSRLTKGLAQIQTKASTQASLLTERKHLGQLERLLERWADAIRGRDAAATNVKDAEKEHGKSQDLASQRRQVSDTIARLRDELTNLGELHQILSDAQSYVAQRRMSSCPVCEQHVDAGWLLQLLGKRIQALTSQEIQAKEGELKNAEKMLKQIDNVESELSRLRRQFEFCQRDVDKLIPQISDTLSLDDLAETKVQARLETAISKSKAECKRLEEQAESLLDQIERLNSLLADLSAGVLPVIVKRVELEAHEGETTDLARKHSEVVRRADEMEAIGTRLERVQKALLVSKERLASERLKSAKPRALTIYKQLVRHPRFSTFEITATPMSKKVEYNFVVSVGGRNGTEREARLVLSDGQITATAIGVFIGLAESAAHGLDLLFIDDPTQNIDLPCKEAMAKLMTEIAQEKQLVLSTHDENFVGCLEEHGFHRHAVVFNLEDWDGNPQVRLR